jgi:glycine dehydrogenase subunit 1
MTTTGHNFLPHTPAEREKMWAAIGVQSTEELFSDIPASLRERIEYQHLPRHGQSELELEQTGRGLARRNAGHELACFLGGGAYARFVPPAVNTIASRSEFYTAYTPYQPEIAQGTLQATYEFQTMIAELTGMAAANASVYDGAAAVAEAALMALRIRKGKVLLHVAHGLHPDSRAVLETYLSAMEDVRLETFDPFADPSVISLNAQGDEPDAAAVILQVPDYWGNLPSQETLESIQAACKRSGALLVISAEPVSLGLLRAPGSYGADIVVGDIQPLGNALNFGGPYGGYIATLSQYARQLPGRLVGKTVEKLGENAGRACYTLTLQTREQHIRRERATSNICTNQALNVLKATVYLSLLGPQGLRELAELSVQRAHALASRLAAIPGLRLLRPYNPFLFEFAMQFPGPVEPLLTALEIQGILAGIPLESAFPEAKSSLLITCTEMTTAADIDRYVETVNDFYGQAASLSPAAKIAQKMTHPTPVTGTSV